MAIYSPRFLDAAALTGRVGPGYPVRISKR